MERHALNRIVASVSTCCWLVLLASGDARAARSLAEEIGRNEVRIYSRGLDLAVGLSVVDLALAERLELRGYRRVHHRPRTAGEFFWGFDNFWIFRLPEGRRPADLVQLELERPTGRIRRVLRPSASTGARVEARLRLPPRLIGESLVESRGRRVPVDLEALPEHVWRTVLAIEDSRFFDHGGVDPRSVARALLKNALAGQVTQGGSTITQQLVKMRDLSPRRTMGRKVSEAVRALALEAEYDKREILAAYLDSVYLGHVEGVAVYGIGAAASAYFSKPASRLALGEAALLAGMIQGPNRLTPVRHPERALTRQRTVLARMKELGWASAEAVSKARRAGLPRLRLSPPPPGLDRRVLAWLRELVESEAPKRSGEGRGFVVHTGLDPLLQRAAETAMADGLRSLRKKRSRLARAELSGALVALDATSGDVLAYVPGDPAHRDDLFDRARSARRQPGSAVKPFVLLEAFESCGEEVALDGSRRVLDRALELQVGSTLWRPGNNDGRFRGPVTVRRAMVDSLNVPLVRVARHCGFSAVADRFRRAGLPLPDDPPPAFVLGAVEISPLELASAYTVFSTLGDRVQPRLISRLQRPSGRTIHSPGVKRRRVSRPSSAFMVRDILKVAVEHGTARAAELKGAEVVGKTGTSSGRRDAWFVGSSGSVVTAVWIGIDSGESLGGGGGELAAPIWREFMARAVPARPPLRVGRPRRVVERWIEIETGLSVGGPRPGVERHLFRRGSEPQRRRPWRRAPLPIID